MSEIINVQNLVKKYDNNFTAVKNLDLKIRQGEIIALLGPNGAGKTTLISTICGLSSITSGLIKVNGLDVIKDYRKTRELIGLVPQELALEPFEKVINSVNFSRRLFGKKDDNEYIEKLLIKLQLFDKKNNIIKSLSGGMKRRVMIAKALSHNPQILFLDEPTAGVDVELRQNLWSNVKELNKKGVTIILTTHLMYEAEEMCNRIAILNKGNLVMLDTTENLLDRIKTKKIIFKVKKINTINPEDSNGIKFSYDTNNEITALYERKKHKIDEIINKIKNAGMEIYDISTDEGNLEDVFINLTKS